MDSIESNDEPFELAVLRAVLDHCPTAVHVIDDSDAVVLCNRAARQRRGCGNPESCHGPQCQLMDLAGGKEAEGKLRHFLATNPGDSGIHEVVHTSKGELATIALHFRHAVVQGRSLRILFQQDVTTEREIDEALRHAQKLEEGGSLRSKIAHEFNNLLYAINGYAELIQEDLGADHPCARYASQILKSVVRGRQLEQKLLTALEGEVRVLARLGKDSTNEALPCAPKTESTAK